MKLSINGSFLSAAIDNRNINVIKFSKAFEERIIKLQNNGYNPAASIIRFVVAWKSEEDEKEYAIILPNIFFVKWANIFIMRTWTLQLGVRVFFE